MLRVCKKHTCRKRPIDDNYVPNLLVFDFSAFDSTFSKMENGLLVYSIQEYVIFVFLVFSQSSVPIPKHKVCVSASP